MSLSVTRNHQHPMSHKVRIRAHELTTDVSPKEGGNDAGPSPHDLYDAALASCKALTVLWYAQRKKIALTDIQVTTERDDSQERAGTYRLRNTLKLDGNLTAAQRQELLSVADKCPVHKLMTQVTTEVTTALAPQ
ncbi:MAG: OsmC family protein [Brachymonas sp.]